MTRSHVDLEQELTRTFPRFEGFTCSEQCDIAQAYLDGDPLDVIGILPTGKGKSLTFLLPTFLWKREAGRALTVVVSPLLALMQDQVDAVERHNSEFGDFRLRVAQLNSSLDVEQRRKVRRSVRDGTVNVLYLGPETLLQPMVFELLADAARDRVLRGLVIDEAHIINQWGDEFRTSFKRMAPIRALLAEAMPPDMKLRTLLLTATMPPAERENVLTSLGIEPSAAALIERKEIRQEHILRVRTANNWDEKYKLLARDARRLAKLGPGIIYCSQRKHCERIAADLNKKGLGRAAHFHGGTAGNKRRDLLQDFQENRIKIMVATCAFGLGVDKPDVRWVLHFAQPGSIDQYYQEIGRGGRDGEPCEALLYYVPADRGQAKRNALKVLTTENFDRRLRALRGSALPVQMDPSVTLWQLMEESTFPPGAKQHRDQRKQDLAAQAHARWNYASLVRAERLGWVRLGPDVLHAVACEGVRGTNAQDLESRAPNLFATGVLDRVRPGKVTMLELGKAASEQNCSPRQLQQEFFDLLYATYLRLPTNQAARHWDTRILIDDLVGRHTRLIEEDEKDRKARQRHGAEKVDDMAAYAKSRSCRRAHFYDTYEYTAPAKGCGSCDVCNKSISLGSSDRRARSVSTRRASKAAKPLEVSGDDEHEFEELSAEDLEGVTATEARDRGLAADIALVTGLTVSTVQRRLDQAHGRTYVSNVFANRWPDEEDEEDEDLGEELDADDLEGVTVSEARDLDLDVDIAAVTGLALSTVWRRLDQAHGRTYVSNVFANRWPDEQDEDEGEDEDLNADDFEGVTAAEARDRDLAADIALVTGLAVSTVQRRLDQAHGRTYVANLFANRWPDEDDEDEGEEKDLDEELDADEFEGVTAAEARDRDLAADIANVTGLSVSTVRRRLKQAHGRTHVTNVFFDHLPFDDEDEEREPSRHDEEIDVDDLGRMSVIDVRDQDMDEILARLTGFTVATVRRRLKQAHGRTQMRNLFAGRWPDFEPLDIDELAIQTVSEALEDDLEKDISVVTGLSLTKVRNCLFNAHSRTYVANAFSRWWPDPE